MSLFVINYVDIGLNVAIYKSVFALFFRKKNKGHLF